MGRLTESEQRFASYGVGADGQPELPPPPYQVGNVHLKFIGIRLAKAAARALLPPELEPAESNGGLICVYSASSGSVVAPFTACYAAVEVKGFNAPDGSSGYYIAEGHYSGGGGDFMRRYYNLNALKGGSRQFREGDIEVGVGGPPGMDTLELRLRSPATPPPFISGVHHYLGRRPGGGSTIFPIAFSGYLANTAPISAEISDLATERFRLARPIELTFATECTEGSLTFGVPQAIGEPSRLADNAAQGTLLNAFARVGRAAIIVSASGEVRNMSAGAREKLGDGLSLSAGRLRVARAEDQRELDRQIATATLAVHGDAPAPIRITRSSSGPLILEVFAIGAAATGLPAALILINDPAIPTARNPGPALQLLGLTAAEARIAEHVGSGLSPRQTAEKIDNAEGTVRTTLKRIYEKLNINRQSELARIVARL